MRITLIEDRLDLAGFLTRALTREGHEVTAARTVSAAQRPALTAPDLVVVDAALVAAGVPRQLAGLPCPVFCLRTGRPEGGEAGELDGGGLDALVARLCRAEADVSAGDLRVEARARRATWRGSPLDLSGHDVSVLAALVRARGEVVTRSTFLLEVWQTAFDPGTNVVDVAVSHLRRRLRDAGADVTIEPVRGLGYRLALPMAAAA